MAAGRCTTIPRAFSYVLPVQSMVTGAVVYGIIYIFTVQSIVFILGVVATGLQFFLGIYCCFLGAKQGIYHRFIIPFWLLALAGIWIAPLYYLTAELDGELKLKQALGPAYDTRFANDGGGRLIWRAVGVAGSAVNSFIDLILLAIFIIVGMRTPHHAAFNPNLATAPSTAHAYAHHAQPSIAPTGSTTLYQASPPTTSTYGPPSLSPPAPMQMQAVYFNQHQGQASPLSSGSNPSPEAAVHAYHQQLQQLQHQQAAQQIGTSPSPALSSTDGKHSTIISTVPQLHQHQHQQQAPYGVGVGYDPQNRIEILRRLVSLQIHDGHWEWSQELHELLRVCGREVTDASPVGMTATANALTVDICQYVWGAQREGREHTALTAAEMITLQGMNWDLGWAQRCTDMAAVWLLASRGGSGA